MKENDKLELENIRKKVSEARSHNFNVKSSGSFMNIEDEQPISSKKIQKEKKKEEKRRRSKDELTSEFKPLINENKVINDYGESKKIVKEQRVNDDKNNNRKEKSEVKKEKKKKEKQPFSWPRFLFKLFMCIAIASFVCIAIFYYVDRFIYNLEHTNLLTQPISGLQKEKDIAGGIQLDSSMANVQYSYNNKYYTFLKHGKVYVYETATGKESAVVETDKEICYFHLLYDKNLIFYITRKDTTYSTTLQIFTYEISSKKTSEYNEFTVSGFNKVKDMEYSPLVNIIYLNVERTVYGSTDNIVYRIDLFNNMGRYITDMIVNKMVMLKQHDILYFTDDKGVIYYYGYPLRIFPEAVDMIGLDFNDYVYFISSDRKKVYMVKNKSIIKTIELKPDEGDEPIAWYSDNTNVYLVYPEYILCVNGDNPNKKIVKMSKYMTFETIKGNTLYLKTSDSKVILKKFTI